MLVCRKWMGLITASAVYGGGCFGFLFRTGALSGRIPAFYLAGRICRGGERRPMPHKGTIREAGNFVTDYGAGRTDGRNDFQTRQRAGGNPACAEKRIL